MDLLSDPSGAHLDVWGVVLASTLAAALVYAINGKVSRWRAWRHHPYRQEIGRYVTTAASATSIFLAIAVASHFLGLPVYGEPILGAVAVTLFITIVVV